MSGPLKSKFENLRDKRWKRIRIGKQRGKIDRQKRKAIFFLLFIPKAFKNEARLSINEKVSDVMFGVG